MNATSRTHSPTAAKRAGETRGPAGAPAGHGQIVGHPGHALLRVRWDTFHASIVYPEQDGAIVHRAAGNRR